MSSVLKQETGYEIPGEEVLLERARALVPWLRTRAAEVEAAGEVPADIIEKFREAGFLRVLQPRRWGGYEMNPSVFFKLLMEVGRGCSSSAWNLMILGVHPWEFGLFDPQAGDDVWSEDQEVIVASSYAPVGKCTKVEGGYMISGRWPTSSGTDHGQWAILGMMVPGEEGQPPVDRIAALVPRTAYIIIDDWKVFGLQGTGSKSLLVAETFVPDHRAHSLADYSLSERGDTHLFPFSQIFGGAVSAVITGMAQGAIDLFVEQMATRRNSGNGKLTSLSPYVKDRLGNATSLVRSCRARLLMMMQETTQLVERRELVPLAERVAYALDIARVGRECEEAVQLLFKATAARGIYLDNPIQRIVRDVMAASNHITQNADDTAGTLGGFLMGEALPPLSFAR